MKIKKISIENFRSIKQANILVSDFNIFVGRSYEKSVIYWK